MRLLLPALALLLLGGCAQLSALENLAASVEDFVAGGDNAEPPKELDDDFEPSDRMTVVWSQTVGKGNDEQIVNLVPAVSESAVYAAERGGEVAAFNRLTGDELWSVDTGLEFSSGPVLAGDKLLVGTSNAELVALSLLDGALLWKTVLSSEILALPQTARNRVVVRVSDGTLYGLDPGTGGTRWNFERLVPPLSVRGLGSPAIAGDLVLDGAGSNKLTALTLKEGQPAWESTIAIPHGRSEVERLLELNGDPVVLGDILYVTGFQAGIAAVDLADGDVLWRQSGVYSSHGLVANKRSLFLSDASSDLWRLDIKNGLDLWKQSDLHQRRLTKPALIRNRLVVGDFEGYLHAVSIDDGSLTGRLELDDAPIQAAPVVFGDQLYILTSEGLLAAVSID